MVQGVELNLNFKLKFEQTASLELMKKVYLT